MRIGVLMDSACGGGTRGRVCGLSHSPWSECFPALMVYLAFENSCCSYFVESRVGHSSRSPESAEDEGAGHACIDCGSSFVRSYWDCGGSLAGCVGF